MTGPETTLSILGKINFIIKLKPVTSRCDIVIPEVSYCDYVWDSHQAHGHLPALVCGLTGKLLTHGEVREEALKVARALESLDVRKGDVVGVILENCVQYPILVQVSLDNIPCHNKIPSLSPGMSLSRSVCHSHQPGLHRAGDHQAARGGLRQHYIQPELHLRQDDGGDAALDTPGQDHEYRHRG